MSVLDEIARIVREEAEKLGVKVVRIILFGSRARGDHREDSDYDILVVAMVHNQLKRKLAQRIIGRCFEELGIDVDVVIVSPEWWNRFRHVPGTILYLVEREGVVISV